MMRVVVLGQPGAFGRLWCRRAAFRLARRLQVPCIVASDQIPEPGRGVGWVVTAAAGTIPRHMLIAADTAIWLHYSPVAVARAWARGLLARLRLSGSRDLAPRLSDVRDSLLHMAWTPHLHQLLRQASFAHLQIFHLRNPEETDFWLRLQEYRVPSDFHVTVPRAA